MYSIWLDMKADETVEVMNDLDQDDKHLQRDSSYNASTSSRHVRQEQLPRLGRTAQTGSVLSVRLAMLTPHALVQGAEHAELRD